MDFHEVSLRGVHKHFGRTHALRGVDAVFSAGELSVVEGPNASGKSTLLALLAQLSRASRGQVLYGETPATGAQASLRAQIGLLAHSAMIYPELSAHENLLFQAKLYGVQDPSERVASLCERFQIGSWAARRSRSYSRGQLQRVALARALLHSPRLLLLDEPATGLDRRSQLALRELLEEERAAGRVLVLVTHDPALSEGIADQRIVLVRGRVEGVEKGLRRSSEGELMPEVEA